MKLVALPVGSVQIDKQYYVGRELAHDGIYPGTVKDVSTNISGWYPTITQETNMQNFQVLICPRGLSCDWKKSGSIPPSGGLNVSHKSIFVPANAVVGGVDSANRSLYIIRAKYQRGTVQKFVCGYYTQGHSEALYSWGGGSSRTTVHFDFLTVFPGNSGFQWYCSEML